MFIAIMQVVAGRVTKMQDNFSTLQEANAFVNSHTIGYPNAFACAMPNGNLSDWLVAPDNTISISPLGLRPSDVRDKRNGILTGSDWTQLPDAPLTVAQKAAWAVYRQLLRDVTAQAGFPASVAWPPVPV